MSITDVRAVKANYPGTTTGGWQEGVDLIPVQGGMVFVPAAVYNATATVYTPCDRSCHIVGEGCGTWVNYKGSILVNNTGVDALRLRGSDSSIRGVCIDGNTATAAANEEVARGLVIGKRNVTDAHPNGGPMTGHVECYNPQTGANDITRNIVVEDVRIASTGGWALVVPGFGKLSDGVTNEANQLAGITLSIFVTMRNLSINEPKKYGGLFIGAGNTTVHVKDSSIGIGWPTKTTTPHLYYWYCTQGETIIADHVNFEGHNPGTNGISYGTNPWVYADGWGLTFQDCRWEEDTGDVADAGPNTISRWFLKIGDNSASVNVVRPSWTRGGTTNGGRPRCMILGAGIWGLNLVNPMANITVEPKPGGVWIEQNHIDFNVNANTEIQVVGTGVIRTPTGTRPLQYAGFPAKSTILGGRVLKAPSFSDSEIVGADNTIDYQVKHNGAIVMNWDVADDGSAAGALEYYWGGFEGGKRLINNAPAMTRAARDARTSAGWFTPGDYIRITNPSVAGRDIQMMVSGRLWRWLTHTALVGGD